MSPQSSELLTRMFPAALLAVLGCVIRINGPQGFVHGFIDWSEVDEATRRCAGRLVGNILFAMAAWVAGYGLFRYFHPHGLATARMIFIGGMSLAVLAMIFMLLRLKHKNRAHGR
jgi:hypothetical protein